MSSKKRMKSYWPSNRKLLPAHLPILMDMDGILPRQGKFACAEQSREDQCRCGSVTKGQSHGDPAKIASCKATGMLSQSTLPHGRLIGVIAVSNGAYSLDLRLELMRLPDSQENLRAFDVSPRHMASAGDNENMVILAYYQLRFSALRT